MDPTKMTHLYLDSPRRELSNGGLGIVVALLVRWGFFVCVFLTLNPAVLADRVLLLLLLLQQNFSVWLATFLRAST